LAPPKVAEFHHRYQPLPMISLAQIGAGVPRWRSTATPACAKKVVHLIEVHGFRKLAFIRARSNHLFAQDAIAPNTSAGNV